MDERSCALVGACGLRAHDEQHHQCEHHHHDDDRNQLHPPADGFRVLRGEGEGVFGGADGFAEHLFVYALHVVIEALLAGQRAAEIVVRGGKGGFGTVAGADQLVLHDDNALDGVRVVAAGKAAVNLQVALHPVEQFVVGKANGIAFFRGRSEHVNHQKNSGEDDRVDHYTFQNSASFFFQIRVSSLSVKSCV